MAMEIENIDSNLSNAMENEAHIEQLLSEKLMEGYVLLEKSCPVCSTPLVKNQASDEDDEDDEEPVEKDVEPVLIPRGSFIEPFKPVQGVPFCVGCSSHVVTQECEISVLEKCHSLKGKGGIFVAITRSKDNSATGTGTGTETNTNPSTDPSTDPSASTIAELEEAPQVEVVDVIEEVQEDDTVHEIIDVTKLEESSSMSHHVEEKKEEEEIVQQDDTDVAVMVDYSVRREIATKVLGAKMLQGYSLMEKQCEKCAMPTMEYQGHVECVVCPALIKKARKMMKAQKKVDKETTRLENKISLAKAAMKAKEIEEAAIEEQKRRDEEMRREEEMRLEKERLEREETERQIQLLLDEEAEQLRRLEMIEKERERIRHLEAESARLVQEAKEKAEQEAKKVALAAEKARTASNEAVNTTDIDNVTLEELRKVKAHSIEQEHAAATQRRKEMEVKLAEDIKRLADMEQRRKLGIASALESMNRDVLVTEHRRRLETKANLDLQIARLEQDILNGELETKTVSEERRVEVEERMIALLEEEAAEKAKSAEEAIRKAKAALEHVHSARREVIAQTIALAEQEAIAEAESLIKKEREDYVAPVILPSASEIKRENWETLRVEGRSVMTRRVMAGWVLLSQFCQGVECHSTPLITKDGKKECVVCGGSGDGKDGAYIEVEDYDVVPTNDELQAMRESGIVPTEEESSGYEITPITPAPRSVSPTACRTFQEIQQDFDTKRDMVSKEIGRRMIEGWTLLDTSCPNCVMPLMMDTIGNSDICVLCGLVSTIQKTDGSTIETAEVPTMMVNVASEEAVVDNLDEAETLPSRAETKSYNEDAETMYTTLPTMKDSYRSTEEHSEAADERGDLPSPPTLDRTEVRYQDDLTESIRQNTQRQRSAPGTPRSDPPASTKLVSKSKTSIDPAPVNMSLSMKSSHDDGFEMTNEEHLKNGEVKLHEEDISANTNMGIHAVQEPVTNSALSMTLSNDDDVKDIVDVFVAANFEEDLSEEMKAKVAEDVRRTMDGTLVTPMISTPSASTAGGDGVIHLEDLPSPQNFKFDMIGNDDQSIAFSKKQRPTPESVTKPRGRSGMPPRPDSTTARSSPRRPPRSTTSRSPHNGTFVVTSGPSDVTSLGDVSRAESVATDALDSILDRIDAAKSILLRDDVSIQEQLAAANLIEKLAQAAVAVKKLERMDRY